MVRFCLWQQIKPMDLNNPRDLSSMYTQEEQDAMSDEEKANAWNQMCETSVSGYV